MSQASAPTGLVAPWPAAEESGEVFADARTRRFADLESWVIKAERKLRVCTWDIPVSDVRVRLLSAASGARRREQLADSARLAELRRVRLSADR